jgi:hypothetical protein
VRKALRHKDFDAPGQLGVKGVALAAAIKVNRSIAASDTLPALRRYTGVLYDALGYEQLAEPLRDLLDEEVVIVSGLLGVVRGGDPVPDYKAPMGATLPGAGRLASFWKPYVTKALAAELRGAVVWDMLPGIHAAAAPVTTAEVHWKVRVQRERSGRLTTVSHENKSIKGALARTIIAERIVEPAALYSWLGPGGYRVRGFTQPGPGSAGIVDLVATSST